VLQCAAVCCSLLQSVAMCYSVWQCVAVRCSVSAPRSRAVGSTIRVPEKGGPTLCNTFQHRDTATHCNTLQHTATHCNTLQHAILISIKRVVRHFALRPTSEEGVGVHARVRMCMCVCANVGVSRTEKVDQTQVADTQ